MLSPVPTAVFDFDHTLTSWDTAARFFAWLLRRNPLKLLIAAPFVLLLSPLMASRVTRRVPIRFAVWVATLGHSHEQLRTLAIAHIAYITGRGEAFLRRDARAQIQLHQSQGHVLVVATGAPEILAREILVSESLGDVIVVGSSLRRFLGGMVADQHCYGERKIPMLRERGLVPPWTFVYSDHESDLPLLRAGMTQFLVNPKPKSVAHLTSTLGNSATVVTWR